MKRTDAGLGIVEIVVSMLILTLIVLGFVPLIATSIRATSQNTELSAANRLVSNEIESVRGSTFQCDGLKSYALATVPDVTVGGETFRITRAGVTCPDAAFPNTALFSVSVTRAGGSTVISRASTRVYLSS